ncbi:MAG: ABC transporter substrate-binding protein [Pseudoclavibacter sp.]
MKQSGILGKLATGVALAAAATLALTGCVSGGAEAPPEAATSGESEALTPVTISVPPTSFATALYAGVSEGIFEAHGFDVTLTPGASMAESAPQLLSGDLQYIWADVHNTVLSAAEGMPIVVGAPGAINTTEAPEGKGFGNILVLEDSPFQDIHDLEGATIGTNSIGGQAQLDNETVMQAAGVDTSSMEWVALPTSQAIAALRQGQVDAITIAEPGGTAAMVEGGVRMIGSADNAIPGAPMFALAATSEWIEADRDRALSFQDAIIEANTLINNDRELATEVMLTFMEMPEEILADSVLPTFAEEAFTPKGTQPVVDRLVEVGAIAQEQVPDLAALLPLT